MNLQTLFSPKPGILKKFYSGRFKHRPGLTGPIKPYPKGTTGFKNSSIPEQ